MSGQDPNPPRRGRGGAESQNVERRLEVAERNHVGTLSEGNLRKSHLGGPLIKIEKNTKAGASQPKASVTTLPTNGSLLGIPRRWGACGLSVVQFDHDEDGMY